MINLPEVTLIGIDCVNAERLSLALDISCLDIKFGAVKLLTSLPMQDSRKTVIPALTTIEAYSQFCLRDLYKYIDTPYALVVQHDGFVLNSSAWTDDFLNYDYIGAPIFIGDWAQEKHGVPDGAVGSLLVGNGGFSLRSKKLMELTATLSQQNNFTQDEPEDWAMCYTERKKLEDYGIRFAPVAIAEKFSFEGRTKEYFVYADSFGFHSLQWTDISRWLLRHPEYKEVIKNEVDLRKF